MFVYVHRYMSRATGGILQEPPFDRKCDCIFIVAFQKKKFENVDLEKINLV